MAVPYLQDEELFPPLDTDPRLGPRPLPLFKTQQPFRLRANGPQLVPQQEPAQFVDYGDQTPDQFEGYLGPESDPDYSTGMIPGMVGVKSLEPPDDYGSDQFQGYVAPESGTPPGAGSVITAPSAPGSTVYQNKLLNAIGDRPERTKPKWWQSLGAAALGGAAGWSNAAGRTRKPIEVDESVDEILNPGYARKLTDWTSRVKQLQGQADIEGKQNLAARQGRQDTAAADLRGAQATAARAHADYWLKRANAEANRFKIVGGKVYDTTTGELKSGPPTSKEKYDEAVALGVAPDQARHYALTGKMPEPAAKNKSQMQVYLEANNNDPVAALAAMKRDKIETAKGSRKPESAEAAEAREAARELRTNRDIDGVSQRKLAQENSINQQYMQAIKAIESSQSLNDTQKANLKRQEAGKTVSALQGVEDEFVRSAARRGITSPDKWQVYTDDQGNVQYKKAGSGVDASKFDRRGGTAKKPDPAQFDKRGR